MTLLQNPPRHRAGGAPSAIRIAVAMAAAALVAAAATILLITLAEARNPTDLDELRWRLSDALPMLAAFAGIWLVGLIVVVAPMWWWLHRLRLAGLPSPILIGGLGPSALVLLFGLLTHPPDRGDVDTRLQPRGSSVGELIEGCAAVACIGALAGLTLWLVSYRRPGGGR
jgi:hypothetical protein